MSLRWWSSCRTNAGRSRNVNEDAFLELHDLGLWLVADGMGGHAKGDVASRMIVDTLKACPPPTSLDEFVYAVHSRLIEVNRLVQEKAARWGGQQIMGSTVVALLVFKGRCACVWAGDSRAYLFRDGRLTQLSKDHNLAEKMVARGELRPEEAALHPAANRITRAIGAQQDLKLDQVQFDPLDGDSVLLCSDGLNKEVSDEEIAAVLGDLDCDDASQELLDISLERGARDNVTVALIRFEVTTGLGDGARTHARVNPGVMAHRSSAQGQVLHLPS
jgi:protein phosphatase